MPKTNQANIAMEAGKITEVASVAIDLGDPLGNHSTDGYVPYACIYDGDSIKASAESWSGCWNNEMTNMSPVLTSTPMNDEQANAATHLHVLYCIDSGCMSH